MADTNNLLTNQNEAICTITLNRPEKRNSLTPDLLVKLASVLEELRDKSQVRCVIITGAGDKAFSSGYDIAEIGKNAKGDMMRDYEDDYPLTRALNAIENYPYPVIAMINGHTFGGGLELAATCDIRISAEGAIFGMPPAKLGVIYTYSALRKFLNLIGLGYTKELVFVGKPINADRALRIGLVNHVVPKIELKEFTYNIASEITENAPLSLSTIKEMLSIWQRNQKMTHEEEKHVKEMIIKVQDSEDYKEGKRAFREKRKPVFRGK